MRKRSPDLDMLDELPDALGTRPDKKDESGPVVIENITELKSKPMQSTPVGVTTYDSIPFSDFEKVDIRIGRITEVSDVPGAKKPLWKLSVNLGDIGTRTIVAGIKAFYSKDQLEGREIVVVTNLKPRSLAGIMSEGMLLAAEDTQGNVSLLGPDMDVNPGCKVQ